MSKLSLIIPSRDEAFLTKTINDIFRNARSDDTEVIAVLDSDKWPLDWKEVTERHGNRLHTIHNGAPIGMRGSINRGVASAKSRGAKYVAKFDAHCGFGEGFDEILKANIDDDWIVVPRRKRLNPETWELTDTHKPDVDAHYLSFPDDPKDFGGPGLNGKIWTERALALKDEPLSDEMSSQGSGWCMSIDYFYRLELMDEASYGKFWNEFQELGLKCWLSGGRVVVNKNTWYSHWHKGKAGRGYKLPESWLTQGATYTKNWIWNEAWDKQTLPFKWLIEKFWPVPTWPENWEEILYATRKPRTIGTGVGSGLLESQSVDESRGLRIISARYGISDAEFMDVRDRLESLVSNGSLDIIVSNSTLTPDSNPFRGKKKTLKVIYSLDSSPPIRITREEKDWLIIGPVRDVKSERVVHYNGQPLDTSRFDTTLEGFSSSLVDMAATVNAVVAKNSGEPMTAAAFNDYLIRKFSISPQRLRGPMPIELRDFHRNDLAQLFAELGFERMVEVGVAEGNYSEVLLKANPEAELILVDPWGDVEGNAQNKGSSRHKFAYEETKRKTAPYPNVRMLKNTSMGVVGGFKDGWFDAAYLDANHSYPFIMEDLINWTRKVRSGGIVALDDVFKLDEARWGAGPMEAIYDYTRAMRINPWWLIAAHKSVDAFFVKP